MEKILKENIGEKEVHPTVKIFEETMEVIKTGDLNKVFEANEEEKKSFEILENAIKKIRYRIKEVKEENKTAILNINIKVPNLKGTKQKLFKMIKKFQPELIEKSESELEEISLKWFKQIIDEELKSKELVYNMEYITIKYKKVENEWEVEDDSEFVKIFRFRIEEEN